MSLTFTFASLTFAFLTSLTFTSLTFTLANGNQRFGLGTTNVGYGTTNTDAGVGIGMKTGGFENLIEKAMN